jgi:putative membrane protein
VARRAAISVRPARQDRPRSGRVDPSRLVSFAYAGLAGGLTLFTALIIYLGIGEIARTLASAGAGLLWVSLFHLVPLAASALGWYTVLAPIERPALRTVVSARWIAESINQLLPALHVGGNVVRARRLARSGVPGPLVGASVVVDITLHLFAQILFTVLGLSLLLARVRGAGLDGGVLVGLVLSALGAAAFYLMQRRGLFSTMAVLLRGVFRSADWSSLSEGADAMDAWIRDLYRHPRAIALSAFWHVLSWLLGAGEIWLALRFLGHPVDWTTALVIESLGEGLRTAAFPIPGALGVQEGGFVLLGGFFGLTPSVSVALSLTKRVRELGLGIPGLIVWQLERAATVVAGRRAESRESGRDRSRLTTRPGAGDAAQNGKT